MKKLVTILLATLLITMGIASAHLPEQVCEADINEDGVINGYDFLLLSVDWGTDNPRSDLDNNGRVGRKDYRIFSFAYYHPEFVERFC